MYSQLGVLAFIAAVIGDNIGFASVASAVGDWSSVLTLRITNAQATG
jgi:hypothetical protein